jgi:hypothetical protein
LKLIPSVVLGRSSGSKHSGARLFWLSLLALRQDSERFGVRSNGASDHVRPAQPLNVDQRFECFEVFPLETNAHHCGVCFGHVSFCNTEQYTASSVFRERLAEGIARRFGGLEREPPPVSSGVLKLSCSARRFAGFRLPYCCRLKLALTLAVGPLLSARLNDRRRLATALPGEGLLPFDPPVRAEHGRVEGRANLESAHLPGPPKLEREGALPRGNAATDPDLAGGSEHTAFTA